TKEGHFAFSNRPGVAAKFWGVNLTFGANYLDREQADQLADQLLRSGYNTVRLHHYDEALVQNGAHSYDLNPEPLDKLDYLFSAFKKRGLYVNIDLYTIRKFTKEEVPELGGEATGHIKELFPVSAAAFESWKQFARNLLTHRNPYTGMTWGEDPALIGICPVNEDPLFMTLEAAPAAIQKIYREKFQQWVSANALSFSSDGEKNALYNRFLAETQARSDARMAQFLRSIGVQTLLTGVNCGTHEALTFVRERYDYVDNHTYMDHPKFLEKSWSLPTQFAQPNTIEFAAQVMREIMPCRVYGKPFAVTEIHFCWPNAYRSSSGIVSAAYAGLQDWDAVYNFDYAGTTKGVTALREGHIFHLVNDPVSLLADRAASVLFLRGDIQPAKGAVCFAVNEKTAYSGDWGKPHWYPGPFSLLGLVTRIGSLTGSADAVLSSAAAGQAGVATAVGEGAQAAKGVYPVSQDLPQRLAQNGVIPAASVEAGGNRFVSETGQIELIKNSGAMKVTSDRSELFALGPRQSQQGRIVSVENGETFGSTYVLSADGKPLAQSERLLVLCLTDSLNSGVQFKNEKATILENNGSLPFLVKRGLSKIALRLPELPGTTWQAWAVDANGARLHAVPLQRADGALLLQAGPTAENGGALAYELKRSSK
ncbi:MAG: hypothetical protein PHQ12_00685, partial [Chthoniobacteraceae bacterium]|nr:hypothetical protein [Chthoniobacteraceae bacterium]